MIKRLLFSAAESLGITERTASSDWRKRRLMILCYHGISLADEHEWNPGLYMPAAMFESRLKLLRERKYQVLSLSEGLDRLRAGTLPRRSVSITFDDGAHDFAAVAAPLLAKYEVPATVYLTSYYVANRYPVFDTGLSYVLWKGRQSGVDLAPTVQSAIPMRVGTENERASTLSALKRDVWDHQLSVGEKDAFVLRVAERMGVDVAEMRSKQLLQLMTEDEVRALPASIDVELHTHRHRTPRDQVHFEEEIVKNRAIIRQLRPMAAAATHFCYPSGDYSASFVPWLTGLGVTSGTTCIPGLASPQSNPLLLPRFVDTTTQSEVAFNAWVSGVAELIPKKRKYVLDVHRP